MKNSYTLLCLLLLTTQLLGSNHLAVKPLTPKIIRVDQSATGANNGTSWADAFRSPHDALANAESGDELWLKRGTYYPTTTNDRASSFILKSEVTIYGSFSGTENNVNERSFSILLEETILSGDIGQRFDDDDNVYHVVRGHNIKNVKLDHITIKKGNANGVQDEDKRGAGLYLTFSNHQLGNLTLDNTSILFCYASGEGGGIYVSCQNVGRLNAVFNKLVIFPVGAAKGGCLYLDLNQANCSINTSNSAFVLAKATDSGGAIYIQNNQKSTLNWLGFDTAFEQCEATNKGGSFALVSSDSSIAQVSFGTGTNLNNKAEQGAGFYFESLRGSQNTVAIGDMIFVDNQASGGNAAGSIILNKGVSGLSKVWATRCTFRDNSVNKNERNLLGLGGIAYNTGKQGLSRLSFNDCTFEHTLNGKCSGGILYNDDNEAEILLKGCRVDTTLVNGDGGIVFMKGGHLTIDSCVITATTASGSGGIIHFEAQEGVHRCRIINSRLHNSMSAYSSSLHLLAQGTAIINPYCIQTSFALTTSNEANNLTAPITLKVGGRQARIEGGHFINCVFKLGKSNSVGAVLQDATSGGLCESAFYNCTFAQNTGNTATFINKTGYTEGVSNSRFINCIFDKNLKLDGSKGKTINNQFEVSPFPTPKPKPIFFNCLVPEQDCSELDQSVCNNMVFGKDPLFNTHELYLGIDLLPCSPAINAGLNDSIPTGLKYAFSSFPSEIGSRKRFWEGIVDIGASEYVNDRHEYSAILDEPNRILAADRAYQDSLGWTHYYNCSEKKLILSIKNDGKDIGRLSDSLKVMMTTTPMYGRKATDLRAADYLFTPYCDDWYVMNRYWEIKRAKPIDQPMEIKTYFLQKDIGDLQQVTFVNGFSNLKAYKVENALAHDTLVLRGGGRYEDRKFSGSTSLTTWGISFGNMYQAANYLVSKLNGSGSMGIRLPGYAKFDTSFDKRQFVQLCDPLGTFKIGDTVLSTGGIYRVKLKTATGCDSTIEIAIIKKNPYVAIGKPIKPDIGYGTGIIQLIDTGYRDGRINSYIWSNNANGAIVKNLKTGKYTVTATDNYGCVTVEEFEVPLVKPMEIPNAFTPNGDGLNDFFTPITAFPAKVTLFKIYNRLGHLIYDNDTPDTGWDGQHKGDPSVSDVYVFFIDVDFGNGVVIREQGEVVLIR